MPIIPIVKKAHPERATGVQYFANQLKFLPFLEHMISGDMKRRLTDVLLI